MGVLKVYSRDEVANLIDQGHLLVIFNGEVLKMDKWVNYHPGGRLPIEHMVGKEARDPLSVYHSLDVLKQMSKFRIGRVELPWVDIEPPISRSDSAQHTHCLKSSSIFTGEKDEKQPVHDTAEWDAAKSTSEWLKSRSISARMQKDQKQQVNTIDTVRRHEVELDLLEYPSVDPETQRNISDAFQKLHAEVREKDLYRCKFRNYMKEMCRYSLLFGLFVTTFRYGYTLTSAVFLGLFWHQIMFSAHDAGHLSITNNFKVDTTIGIFIADFCCGLSMGWWKSSHNVHHLVPNHIEHDPDIQNVPLFATSASFCRSLRSTYYGCLFPWDAAADVMVQIQQYTYYPVMALARFNLYFLSWGYLISDKAKRLPASTWTRPLEVSFMLCYWYWFGYRLVWLSIPTWTMRVAFVMTSHLITMPLHVQITLSHWGMSTTDLGPNESFVQKQLRTTMDVDCPAWLDWIHGGLQFQAVHHLFPRIPRHNLRETQTLVRSFCKENGLKYTIFKFVEGNQVVLGRLEEISKQLHMLAQCQNDMSLGLVH